MNARKPVTGTSRQIQTVDAYKTSDGKIHTSRAVAEEHQAYLDVEDYFRASDVCFSGVEWDSVLKWVVEHYHLALKNGQGASTNGS